MITGFGCGPEWSLPSVALFHSLGLATALFIAIIAVHITIAIAIAITNAFNPLSTPM
jgi:hypothetical protein